MTRFEIGERDFLLDGEPMQLVSGALHYFRVHPDLWADRIRKARLMGLNAIETYVPWNFHAPSRGEFRTTGRYDLGRFLDLVDAEGLHAVVRPGPYICAEWDGGGLPAWLFAADDGRGAAAVRCADPAFLTAIGEYFGALLPIVAKRQVTAGGPVLAVQVENEYGAYGDDPPERREEYLRALVDLLREYLDVPLFTVDQANDHHQSRGGLPELHRMASFGSRSTERLEVLRRHQPTGPLMSMEFWNGWFDSWGQHHHTAAPGTNARDLDDLLAAGASVNLYMFHGGTNFGLTNGANDKGTYLPIATSYDYDAPLAEHGAVTPKFHAMREVIGRYRDVPEETPATVAPAPAFSVTLRERLPLVPAAPDLGRVVHGDRLLTHDDVGHWSGLSVYTTRVRADDGAITFGEVRDRAIAFVDGAPVGTLSRTLGERTLPLPAVDGELTLLVEDQGRVSYGARIGEAKGLIGPARTATREVTDWSLTPLALDGEDGMLSPVVRDAVAGEGTNTGAAAGTPPGADRPVAGPVLCRAEFTSEPGADHFLRLDGWTKGLAWVNGWPLGRYWSHGPTRTMYVPGPVLREHNELVVLELHGAASAEARFVAAPDLGHDEE
ncbi:glycoside hydrolase family 35 protein [Myceligenerans indicum]|uniref:Beta-galactosidase n=1 Tax=Myceligenerans indicum TaxID=2593663 RepID=A0ABS1LES6_9MICO|nr:beta-galactosidase family protein [Myceligenerans indicum]MBL0884761.1 beta-galactosidase [Myceligenerans indicum]